MIKVLLALFLILVVITPGVTWFVAQRPVPILEGVGEVNGMQKAALVRYDGRAIPYIKAESDEDMYAAQGYVVARERMFQMDMLRRAAEGRTAQVFGITALPTDRLMRTIGFERLATEELHYLSPQAKLAVEAYSRGVNAYLSENGDKLPLEFTVLQYKPEAWRDVDSLAVMKYLAYELDESWKLDEVRWRVTNHVGDDLAGRLFNDNLAVSSWSPEPHGKGAGGDASGAVVAPAAATPGGTAGGAAKSAKGTSLLHKPAGAVITRPHVRSPRPAATPGDAGPTEPGTQQAQPGAEQGPPGAFIETPSGGYLEAGEPPALRQVATDERLSGKQLLSEAMQRGFRTLAMQSDMFRKPDRSWGSTAFVLAPAFCKSNGAMMAADKHSGLTTPCEYFLCSLASNGQRVAGAALPGVPGIMFGRNANTSFSGASMHADVQDLFVEHFASETDTKYKSLEKVETAREFHEGIPVRFGKDVDHKITVTRHGPVLLRDKDSAIALSWSGFETKKPWLNTVCALNRANDWDSFTEALSTYGGPPQLYVFADKRGNVGCHGAGIIPVRAAGAQGTTMSEGWLSKGEWISSVGFDDLPQSFLPATSSGRPSGDFCVAAGQKLAAAPGGSGHFPQLWGHQWDPPYRANRLALSLPRTKGQKLDLFDFNAYQGDELNMMASLLVSELRKAMDSDKSIDATQTKAMEFMQKWDNCMKHDSVAASLYESFIGTLARRLIEPKLGREMTNEYFQNWPLWTTFVEDYLRRKPKDLLPPEERTYESFMITTFAKSNTRLKLLFKNDKVGEWQWDKAHLARFRSFGMDVQGFAWLRYLLDITNVGVGGDSNCLNACDVDRISVAGPLRCFNGPAVRLLIDMADDEVFYGNLALGQSGHYCSPYRQDQLKSWLHADPLPIAFSEAQIEKQTRQKFYLSAPGYR